jgi:futalosine hydrolase
MNILLVSATNNEIRPLTGTLTLTGEKNDGLTQYQFRDIFIDILVTGIGMTATAFHLGKQLSPKKYDLCINAGICGSYNPEIKIGDVIEVVEENFSEFGAEEADQFKSIFEIGLMDPDDPSFRHGKLFNPAQSKYNIISGLLKVKGITASTIHSNESLIQKMKEQFGPDTESMEGAAFFYSCLLSGIPFYEIRSVSNYVGERDRKKWDIPLAVENLNSVLFNILEELSK